MAFVVCGWRSMADSLVFGRALWTGTSFAQLSDWNNY
ncbi:hypothetical protein J2S47_006773 [Streptomyces griseoviridis]|uniref:Uncharacterized protein n=1 Tax=Streptomyces griseoviridis TaxID=45398 RepID=A0ABT9LRV2_STRGD|nr:hypothetical protein [Streptomyces griseoviridis]